LLSVLCRPGRIPKVNPDCIKVAGFRVKPGMTAKEFVSLPNWMLSIANKHDIETMTYVMLTMSWPEGLSYARGNPSRPPLYKGGGIHPHPSSPSSGRESFGAAEQKEIKNDSGQAGMTEKKRDRHGPAALAVTTRSTGQKRAAPIWRTFPSCRAEARPKVSAPPRAP
jgi:hypothetical protein